MAFGSRRTGGKSGPFHAMRLLSKDIREVLKAKGVGHVLSPYGKLKKGYKKGEDLFASTTPSSGESRDRVTNEAIRKRYLKAAWGTAVISFVAGAGLSSAFTGASASAAIKQGADDGISRGRLEVVAGKEMGVGKPEGFTGGMKEPYENASNDALAGYKLAAQYKKDGTISDEAVKAEFETLTNSSSSADSKLSLASDDASGETSNGETSEDEQDTAEVDLVAKLKEAAENVGKSGSFLKGFDAGNSDDFYIQLGNFVQAQTEEIQTWLKEGDETTAKEKILKALRGRESQITTVNQLLSMQFENDIDEAGKQITNQGHVNLYVEVQNAKGESYLSCVSVPVTATNASEVITTLKTNLVRDDINLNPQIYENVNDFYKYEGTFSVDGAEVAAENAYVKITISGTKEGKYDSSADFMIKTDTTIGQYEVPPVGGYTEKPTKQQVFNNAIRAMQQEDGMSM